MAAKKKNPKEGAICILSRIFFDIICLSYKPELTHVNSR